ncbi:MAG: hypothetical protein LBQ63_05195, partial [Deltaproteobacteria bacterium]|nr:hypothetical protein [Deltaproteobacteria bacterium]
MKYNAPPGSQNPDAPYVNGIPGLLKGSPVNAQAVEYPQREIVNVIQAAGLTPTNEQLNQLLEAIPKVIPEASADEPGLTMSAVESLPGTAVLRDADGRAQISAPVEAADIMNLGSKYDLCEFYYFRHPTLKPGFQACQGGLLADAATRYPEAWAYLQTTEGQRLCKTEADWQAMTTATWATLADGTKVGWNGIGGAPFFAPNTGTGALRLPDLRGMYAEAAGYDSLGVGGTHGDGIRDIRGRSIARINSNYPATGAFVNTGILYPDDDIYGGSGR